VLTPIISLKILEESLSPSNIDIESDQTTTISPSKITEIKAGGGEGAPARPSRTKLEQEQIDNPIADTGIVSINAKGKILYSNRKAHKIFECKHLTGTSIHNFVPKNFKERHTKMIQSFFDRVYVGERLDPDTIIRAVLKSGKQVPLNLALETKVDFVTGKPLMVVAFITEASTLIEQSKVEKMLSRATLVVFQQFVSQSILSAVAFYELMNTPKLKYNNEEENDTTGNNVYDDEINKLAICKEYSYQTLSNGNVGGEDDKMLFFIIGAGLTVLIAVLPLFVNKTQESKSNDKDDIKIAVQNNNSSNKKNKIKRKPCFWYFRQFANALNDFQE